jgi:hypothetical protein
MSALPRITVNWAVPQVDIWLPVHESTLYVTNATSISVITLMIAIAQAAAVTT